ncbi:MAG: alpha/beta fold hydrolase, partial [Caldilineae bacterium]|nr:alpha/beta fold hydrolase [Caldilineae bacterium]
QLREAGAVILGKANLSELAGGVALFPAGYTAVAGQTINPHGANFPTLGSSSGSGASTAALLTMVSVGSETGGSLIAPAALNGVVGMYPTDDLVPDEGVIPLVSSTDTAGPIGRSVTDVSALLGAIDTADVDYTKALDANALNGVTAGFFAADLSPENPALGLRGFEDTSDQVEKVQLISDILAAAGAETVPAELLPIDELTPSDELIMSMFGPTLAQMGITDISELDDETRAAIEQAVTIPSIVVSQYFNPMVAGGVAYDMVDYLVDAGAPITSLAELQAYNNEMPERRIPNGQYQIDTALPLIEAGLTREVYEQLAVDAQPVLATELDTIFEATGAEVLVSMVNEHSSYYALAGYPAITVPLGLRANGAPTGVTLIGKPGQDAELLAYAYAFEQASMLKVTPDLDAVMQQTAGGSTTSVAESTFGEAWESVDCESIDVAPTVAAVADCGLVTVPANRANGSDQLIQLAVVRINSPSEAPGAPVFLGTGGPGGYGFLRVQKALDSLNWPATHAALLANHDWVYFTQRGTKGANPELKCPAVDSVSLDTALEGWDEDQSIETFTQTLQECYDTLTEQGINLDGYNSVENAEDVNDIRQALGYDQIIYYGQSYGTQLGQFVMRQHPEILQAVILDGVVPVEFSTYAQTQNMGEAFQRVFAACEADDDCSANYPDLENTLAQVYDALQANPATIETVSEGVTQTLYIDGLAVMSGLATELYGGGANVPHLIYALKDGDLAALKQMAPSDSPLSPHARMMNYAVNCSDDPNSSLDDFPLSSPVQAYNDYIRDDALRYVVIPCPTIDVPQLPDSSDAPIESDLPVLVLSGALDPVTPPSHGEKVAGHLPNSQHVVFPDGGHIQTEKPCAQEIIVAFTDDPMAPVDTSCLAAQQTFLTPAEIAVTNQEGNATLTATLPAGFKPTSASQWQSGTDVIAVVTLPAGTAAPDAIEMLISRLGAAFDPSQVVDGPAIDGLPSKLLPGAVSLGGVAYDSDAIAFETPNSTFVILAMQGDHTELDRWRTTTLPSILETVTVN